MSGSGRRIWLSAGAVLGLVVLGYGALVVVELLAAETRTEALALPPLDGVQRVRVQGAGGSVTVTGTDDRTVAGTVRLRGGLRKPSHSERVEGDTLVLRSSCPNLLAVVCDADFDLEVPRGMDVEADVSGGGVTATGLSGRLDIDSSGGGITLRNVGGDAVLDSSGGGIALTGGAGAVVADSSGGGITLRASDAATVELHSSGGGIDASFRTAPDDVRADSSGGGITVELPDDGEPYRVDADSSGGSTEVAVRTAPDAERTVAVSASGGGVTVRYAAR